MGEPVWMIAAVPVPVDDARDFLDYVAVWSGFVGAMLAAAAVLYAAWQAKRSKQDLIRERRVEFELGLLAELRRQMSVTRFQHLTGYIGALIVRADDETDIPTLRAIVNTKAGPVGRQRRDDIKAEMASRGDPTNRIVVDRDTESAWVEVAEAEIDQAIQRRLEE